MWLTLLSLACAPDPCDRAGVICTMAGMPGQAGQGDEEVPATQTTLYMPEDVAFSGSVWFIADDNNHAVREVDANGIIRTIAGSNFLGDGPEGDAMMSSLNHPASITVDPQDPNLLWIVATGNHRVKLLDRAASTVRAWVGTGEPGYSGDGGPALNGTLQRPTSVVVDPADGSMYISDKVNQVIRRVDAEGVLHTFAGTPDARGYAGDGGPAGDALLHAPVGQELQPGNRITLAGRLLYVADSGNHVVRVIDLDTTEIRTVAGRAAPGADGDGGDALDAALYNPYDVAIGPDGTLFIADTGNHCVRAVALDGVISTAAGVCGQSGYAGDEADATQALLAWPGGVATSPDGDLWIADTMNHVVRRVRWPTGR